ncbi:Crp/Fnr family transcriptional regulator [Tenuifilum sp.]|uniref:Crp/Fnr family transcriptional regulator n=1 Tax=Tenuifilum sp. TaxID=2760880 RepID=UPI001B7BCE92|nr:Crp/Fnr family transcriptional regulator [Bacteroidales bacterium]HOK60128.1 Crp/Fnr family transcriptional regulator [Tenuifilum sp.]MBP9029607.1 Crp/Fnr family transcriptional regulator [Bacteroidales bacterium]HOK85599.1 Crp/Fnr family transcriptional regulator [Tenuifilum sp.]HON69617.1 Crp/Fnr family transcriptional regulator [Tenuifilum sp.]
MKPDCKLCKMKSPAAELLRPNEIDTLEQNCAQVKFAKGETIFREGTFATNIVYLRSGLVKIHMKGPIGEKILRLNKAPAYLGLPTTFGDKVNHYSATTLVDSEVCFISLDAFKKFIFSNGDFAYEIIMDLCRSELADFQRFTNLSQKQLPGRIAELLLCFSNHLFKSNTFELPLNITELANFVSASRESVSRQFSELIKLGIIEITSGKKLIILRKEMLEKISTNG